MNKHAGIESYNHTGSGYSPLLIRPGWQVARLNYMPELAAPAIKRLDRHGATDEVFILFQGAARLISAEEAEGNLTYEVQRMEPCVTYNIPAGVWHAIAMTPDDVVMIVEKDNTHLNDVAYRELTATEYEALQAMIHQTQNPEDVR